MQEETQSVVEMKPFHGLMFRTAEGRQLSIEEAVERYVDLTFQEVKEDLIRLRQPQSMQEITKLPPAAIAGLTHKCEGQMLIVDTLDDPVSERQWLIVKNPFWKSWMRKKRQRRLEQRWAEPKP